MYIIDKNAIINKNAIKEKSFIKNKIKYNYVIINKTNYKMIPKELILSFNDEIKKYLFLGPNNTLERIIPNVDDLFIIHINNKYVGSFVLNYSSFVTFNNIYINELYRGRDLCNKFISIGIKYSNKKHYELTVLNNIIPAY
jgi:hypothetical protein